MQQADDGYALARLEVRELANCNTFDSVQMACFA